MKTDIRRRMLWRYAAVVGVLLALSFLRREPGAFRLGIVSGVVLVAALWFATGAFRRNAGA